MEKFAGKLEKAPLNIFFWYRFLQLYIGRVGFGSGSGENFPDLAKSVRMRPDPDPQPWYLPVQYL